MLLDCFPLNRAGDSIVWACDDRRFRPRTRWIRRTPVETVLDVLAQLLACALRHIMRYTFNSKEQLLKPVGSDS